MSINVVQRGLIKSLSFLMVFISYIMPNWAGNISCTSSYSPTSNVNMGTFDPYNYTNIVIPVTLTITCSGPENKGDSVSYLYTFDGGGSGDMSARRMALSSNYVNYGVCTTSGCTQNYGTGSKGTYLVSNNYRLPKGDKSDSWILYFVVPVQPLSTPGTYNDTINVSLSLTY